MICKTDYIILSLKCLQMLPILQLQVNAQMKLKTKLNSDFSSIHTWLVSNKLALNISKTEYMIIGSRHQLSKIIEDPKINIGGQNIKRVKSTKSLGVVIDEKLNSNEHFDSKEASKGIDALKLIKHYRGS